MLPRMAQIFFPQHARIKRGRGNSNFLNSHSKINENVDWMVNKINNFHFVYNFTILDIYLLELIPT